MDKHPRCPYCEATKENPDGIEMRYMWEIPLYKTLGNTWWQCPKCGSRSPAIEQERDPASDVFVKSYHAAMKRCRPMQKPLTLEVFLKDIIAPFPVWLEKKEDGSIEPIIPRYFRPTKQGGFVVMDGFCGDIDKYGIEWRVWYTLEKPTVYERAAAKWEEDVHG